MADVKLPPGWLAADVDRAAKRVNEWEANANASVLARGIADVVRNSQATHDEKFSALTAVIAALGAP